MIEIAKSKCFPLSIDKNGKHIFGGLQKHNGVLPDDSNVPVHLLLTIDLSDTNIPVNSTNLKFLPLYYPLKYGLGGPSMQYEVVSDTEINIIYLSDPKPDDPDSAYVKVDAFPEINYMAQSPVDENDLDWFTITIGGNATLDHESDRCENPNCPNYHTNTNTELIAAIPPIPIAGHDEIWWDFDGAYMIFYFWLCRGCNTIITCNRCT